MDFGRLLSISWIISWRHKFLWIMGLLAVLGSGGGSVTRILLNLALVPDTQRWQRLLTAWEALLLRPDQLWSRLGPFLGWGSAALFVFLLGGWLLFALAEAVIIRTSLAETDGKTVTIRSMLRQGYHLLGRFVAIDAAVFFPLFLLLLFMIVLAGGVLIGGLVSGLQNESMRAALTPILLGAACLLPLICLMVPLTLATTTFRTLAFRQVAVSGDPVRATVGQTWTFVRAHWGPLLAVFGVLWGLQMVINTLIGLINVPLMAIVTPLGAVSPLASAIIVGLVATLLLLFEAFLHTFTAVTWTVAFATLSESA